MDFNLDHIRQAIDAGNAQWMAACRQSDAARVTSLFDEQGVLLSWRGDVVRGRPAIAERMAVFMRSLGPAQATVTTLKVWVLDGVAYETGRYTYHYQEEGQPASTAGRYVVIWKPQPDGTWQIALDMSLPDETAAS